MYYIVVTQKFGDIRNTITIAGKNKFTDLFDDNKLMDPRYVMIKDKAFKEIIADGFSTEEEAMHADDMIEALEDFIGGMFDQQYFVMSEEELKKSYKIVKQIYEKVAA